MGGSEILHIKDIKLLYLLHFCGLPQIAADLPIPARARVSEFAFPCVEAACAAQPTTTTINHLLARR